MSLARKPAGGGTAEPKKVASMDTCGAEGCLSAPDPFQPHLLCVEPRYAAAAVAGAVALVAILLYAFVIHPVAFRSKDGS